MTTAVEYYQRRRQQLEKARGADQEQTETLNAKRVRYFAPVLIAFTQLKDAMRYAPASTANNFYLRVTTRNGASLSLEPNTDPDNLLVYCFEEPGLIQRYLPRDGAIKALAEWLADHESLD